MLSEANCKARASKKAGGLLCLARGGLALRAEACLPAGIKQSAFSLFLSLGKQRKDATNREIYELGTSID